MGTLLLGRRYSRIIENIFCNARARNLYLINKKLVSEDFFLNKGVIVFSHMAFWRKSQILTYYQVISTLQTMSNCK